MREFTPELTAALRQFSVTRDATPVFNAAAAGLTSSELRDLATAIDRYFNGIDAIPVDEHIARMTRAFGWIESNAIHVGLLMIAVAEVAVAAKHGSNRAGGRICYADMRDRMLSSIAKAQLHHQYH